MAVCEAHKHGGLRRIKSAATEDSAKLEPTKPSVPSGTGGSSSGHEPVQSSVPSGTGSKSPFCHGMRAYVINLPSSYQRFAKAKLVMQSLGLPFEKVVATAGADVITECHRVGQFHDVRLNDNGIQVLGQESVPVRCKQFDVVPGTLGCSLSHLRAWQHCFATETLFHAIFEDDVCIPEGRQGCDIIANVGDAIKSLAISHYSWDVMLLGIQETPATDAGLQYAVPISTVCGDLDLLPISRFWQSHAYILHCHKLCLPEVLKRYILGGFAIDNAMSKAARDGVLSVVCFATRREGGYAVANLLPQRSQKETPSVIRGLQRATARKRIADAIDVNATATAHAASTTQTQPPASTSRPVRAKPARKRSLP